MMMTRAAFLFLPTFAWADAPTVVTDIAPIHSLTAMVMEGVGEPHLLLPPEADPHDFALRPSDAATLDDAQLIVWIGHALTPWLEAPLENLASDAVRLELLDIDGWKKLSFAEDAHDHDHGHGHDEGVDPHAWMSPTIAAVWVDALAAALSEVDPSHAETYAQNAANAVQTLLDLDAEIAAAFEAQKPAPYVLSHANMQYFEVAYNVPAAATISDTDAAEPGPAHIAELKSQMDGVACILHEQANKKWATLLAEGTGARIARLDILGIDIPTGPDLYPTVLRRAAQTLVTCAD